MREILESGGEAKAFVVDVTDRARIAEVAEQIRAEFGPVDILINNVCVVTQWNRLPLCDGVRFATMLLLRRLASCLASAFLTTREPSPSPFLFLH